MTLQAITLDEKIAVAFLAGIALAASIVWLVTWNDRRYDRRKRLERKRQLAENEEKSP